MRNIDATAVRAGTFVIVSLVAFVVGVLVVGGERNFFVKEVEFFASFKDVIGFS